MERKSEGGVANDDQNWALEEYHQICERDKTDGTIFWNKVTVLVAVNFSLFGILSFKQEANLNSQVLATINFAGLVFSFFWWTVLWRQAEWVKFWKDELAALESDAGFGIKVQTRGIKYESDMGSCLRMGSYSKVTHILPFGFSVLWLVAPFLLATQCVHKIAVVSLWIVMMVLVILWLSLRESALKKKSLKGKNYGWNMLLWAGGAIVALILQFKLHDSVLIPITAVALIIYSLLGLLELSFKEQKKAFDYLKLLSLLTIFSGVTVYSAFDYVRPRFLMVEEFSESHGNVNYRTSQDPHNNIFFHTKLHVEVPIDLRIKDTYTHLTHKTDYDVTDRNRVFINYEFGNEDLVNEAIAQRGLIFTYETRDWWWSRNYREYRKNKKKMSDVGLIEGTPKILATVV